MLSESVRSFPWHQGWMWGEPWASLVVQVGWTRDSEEASQEQVLKKAIWSSEALPSWNSCCRLDMGKRQTTVKKVPRKK